MSLSRSFFGPEGRSDFGQNVQSKQENVEIVIIRDTNPMPVVSISQLMKHFADHGRATQDVRVQIKEFSFHTEFPNIYSSDYLNVWASVQVVPDGTSFTKNISWKTTDIPFKIPLMLQNQQQHASLTSVEFVEVLNRSKNHAIATQMDVGYGDYPHDRNQKLCTGVLSNMNFEYDSGSGKIVVNVEQVTKLINYDIDADDGYQLDECIDGSDPDARNNLTDVTFLIQTGSGMADDAQYRLGNCFGFGLNTSRVDQIIGIYQNEFYSKESRLYLRQGETSQLMNSLGFFAKKYRFYAPYYSDMYPVKFVVLISSGRSNHVFNDGHRESLMSSFAVSADSTALYQTHTIENDLYAVTDSIQGIKSLQLQFVDERGSSLYFRSPYELKLAVFFD